MELAVLDDMGDEVSDAPGSWALILASSCRVSLRLKLPALDEAVLPEERRKGRNKLISQQ
jgi:hypothetical protein